MDELNEEKLELAQKILANNKDVQENFKQSGISAEAFARTLASALRKAGDSAKEFSETTANLFNPDLNDFFTKIDELKGKIKVFSVENPQLMAGGFAVLSSSLIKARDDFKDLDIMQGQSIAGASTLSQRYKEMNYAIQNAKLPSALLGTAAFEKFEVDTKPEKGESSEQTESRIRETLSNALDMARNQEYLVQQIQYQAGQTGALDKLFEKTENLKSLNEYAAEYNKIITETGNATGLTRGEVSKYYETFSKVPGAMEQVVSGLGEAADGNDRLLSSMITVSRGANIPMSNLNEILGNLRNNFNMTFGADNASAGNDALEFMATMSKASNDLGLNFNSLKGSIDSISSSFSMYGNTSRDVVYGFHQIAKSLEATGLSAESSGKMAQTYISHFSELSMAQKSYISQMSGGAGGLMGAFQIEQQLREGNFKSVFEKFQTTLQKQVGPIVSGEEAAQSEASASRRLMQMQMLRSGPLGSLVKDDASAGRLLDAMSESAKGVKPLEEASRSLSDIYNAGKQRQSRESTHSTMVEASLNEITYLAEVIAYNTSQSVAFGNKASGTAFGNVEESNLKNYIKGVQESYKRNVAEKTTSESGGTAGEKMYETTVPMALADAANTAQTAVVANFDRIAEALERSAKEGGNENFANKISDFRKDGFTREEISEIIKANKAEDLKDPVQEVAKAAVKEAEAKKQEEHKHTLIPQQQSGGEVKFVCADCSRKMYVEAKELAHALTGHSTAVTGATP